MKQLTPAANETDKSEQLSAFSKSKREQIIKGAIKVFLKYGYEGTSMNRVAEEAGVIKQTIYSHFNDKEGLFKAIIKSLTFDHFEAEFGQDWGVVTIEPEALLRKVCKLMMQRQRDKQYIALMRTVIGESNRFPELTRLYTKTVIERGIRILTSYFSAHAELQIADPEATSRIFMGALVNNVLLSEILYGNEILPFDSQRLVDPLVQMVMSQSANDQSRCHDATTFDAPSSS